MPVYNNTMNFIVSALYFEAKNIISSFKLKKIRNFKKYQIFRSDHTVLILSGVGVWNTIFATTYLLSNYNKSKDDRLYNIGSCGSVDPAIDLKKIFIPNKIIYNGKNFYPDILEKHPFEEGVLNTLDLKEKDIYTGVNIVDNEAAGVFFSAEKFLYLNNITFIKIVTDDFFKKLPEKRVILETYEEGVKDVIEYLTERMKEKKEENKVEINHVTDDLKDNLKLSETMFEKLKKLIRYSELTGIKIDDCLKIRAKDKREGKKIIKEIENRLIE